MSASKCRWRCLSGQQGGKKSPSHQLVTSSSSLHLQLLCFHSTCLASVQFHWLTVEAAVGGVDTVSVVPSRQRSRMYYKAAMDSIVVLQLLLGLLLLFNKEKKQVNYHDIFPTYSTFTQHISLYLSTYLNFFICLCVTSGAKKRWSGTVYQSGGTTQFSQSLLYSNGNSAFYKCTNVFIVIYFQ